MFSDPCPKISKDVKRVPIPRDEFTLTSIDVRQRSKAINLRSQTALAGVKAAWDASCVEARQEL
jgi:hypothetical protein